jgi:SecD/SecF fusion protein
MAENLGRKTILIFLLLAGSVLSMLLPTEPFRLGLDLKGGTRLHYKLDWDQALAEGKISQAEFLNKAKLLGDTLSILRERVDPNGTLEASFIAVGDSEFVIEIPVTANITGADASALLLEDIDVLQGSLSLATTAAEMLNLFPTTGGSLEIGGERMTYESRRDTLLRDLERGVDGTKAVAHLKDEVIELKGEDPIKALIENPGSMKLYIGATDADFPPGSEIVAEQAAAVAWRAANPETPTTIYNQQLAARPGQLGSIRAFPRTIIDEQGETIENSSDIVLLVNPQDDWSFTGDDLKNVSRSQDNMGYPAVGLSIVTEKEFAFGDFTGASKGKLMAIVLNDVIVSMATINKELPGDFIITGGNQGFREAEVAEMVRVLKSGSLIMKPELLQSEQVGAKLGDEYVKRGLTSALLGLSLVLVFMMVYYRKLGIFAAISLLSALTLLMGGMAFLRATLTLPGVAGIILTVGMAVDANILIYERIREELARGRKLPQACENGFNRAFVTIIDANLTTFITGFILYTSGTGPVRGFATTLMIGIITAVFAALVITRVMVERSIAGGTESFKMGQLVGKTSIKFIEKAKIALPISAVLIFLGVGLFVSLPKTKTLGIDFVGGSTVTVNLEEPQQTSLVRERISGITGDLGKSAEVVALRASGNDAEGYRTFRITYKSLVDPAMVQKAGAEATSKDDIHEALLDILAKGPVNAVVTAGIPSGRIYFEESHQPAELQTILAAGGLGEVQVTAVDGFPGSYDFSGTASPASNATLLNKAIGNLFSAKVDSGGNDYLLSNPIPESSEVGAQVVGEMRDSAILAILISLFAIVMYIRARFAEYSFSFAAVAALVHDVLMTLGALAICDQIGIVNAEISLPMIAAFLTIIGYSLNDTIVVFDRIRENRPRMADKSLTEVLNISINQTLSRTLLTSMTTLIAVLILFIFNYGGGSVLEGFAFALTFGVFVGTYSSVFVAAPALVFFENKATQRKAKAAKAANSQGSAA